MDTSFKVIGDNKAVFTLTTHVTHNTFWFFSANKKLCKNEETSSA